MSSDFHCQQTWFHLRIFLHSIAHILAHLVLSYYFISALRFCWVLVEYKSASVATSNKCSFELLFSILKMQLMMSSLIHLSHTILHNVSTFFPFLAATCQKRWLEVLYIFQKSLVLLSWKVWAKLRKPLFLLFNFQFSFPRMVNANNIFNSLPWECSISWPRSNSKLIFAFVNFHSI